MDKISDLLILTTYKFNCKYMTVLAKVHGVVIKPVRTSYYMDEELTCKADGNPEPTYRWTNLETGHMSYGPTLALRSDILSTTTSGQNFSFRCTAMNFVGGKNETSFKDVMLTLKIAGTRFIGLIIQVNKMHRSESTVMCRLIYLAL